jgi:hypothetical protein
MADPFWQTTIQWTIWGIAMSLVMGALARSRNKVRLPMDENKLVHPRSTLILGVVCSGFFVSAAILSVAFIEKGGWGFAIFFLAFSLLGAPIIVDYYLARHELTGDGLNYGTMFKGRHSLKWADVTSIRYSQGAKWFLVFAPGKPVARISAMLLGLPAFAKEVLNKVPGSRIETQAQQVLRETAQGNLPRIWH